MKFFLRLVLKMQKLTENEYSLDSFLRDIIYPHSQLIPVQVFKRRFAFTINDCITELGEIQFNGATQQTVAVESVDIEAILKAKECLGSTTMKILITSGRSNVLSAWNRFRECLNFNKESHGKRN